MPRRQKIRRLLLFVSFLFFPATLYYFSPYLILTGGAAGVVSGSFLMFAALFLGSLVFGRAFCGWLCPAGGLQECCRTVVDTRLPGRRMDRIKFWIWVPWLIGIAAAFVHAGGIRSVHPFYMTNHGFSAADLPGLATYFAVVALIAGLAMITGRRAMCRSICWMAPFMILGVRLRNRLGLPSLRLVADPSRCTGCGTCSRNCPMSLEVAGMVRSGRNDHPDCILCGVCADGCSRGVLSFAFQTPSRNSAGEGRPHPAAESPSAAPSGKLH
ncbi:4Fe-4S binding protein [Paenibacillus glufosinatiresistens]|uniref:4Fe-4S binding protein n=1 Tax=Paenibacillus glufosinatiresistens TaxID=3070657 RepID=UPI00286DFAC6|nr:4Fe-4S binding protein [Paenibacillus sp. YX.27]